MSISDRDSVLAQYRDSSNLDARVRLHEQFSTNHYGWHPWVFDQIEPRPGQNILEVGCGPGHLWRQNRARIPESYEIILSDLSTNMLIEARSQLPARPEFRYVVGDVQQLPLETATFDVVIANHMLYHVPDLAKGLTEIRRVLRPGGRFTTSTVGEAHLRELADLISRFAPEWQSWASAEGNADAFTLENGADQLARYFRHVELRRYVDALVVTEAQPLLAYVLSGSAGVVLASDQIDALSDFISNELAQNGALRITKDSGLFMAW